MPNKNRKQVASFGHDQLVRVLNASEDHKISRLGALKALGLSKTRATLDRLSQVINDLEAEERLKKIGGHSVCLVAPPSRSTPTKFQSDFLEVLEQAETQQLSRVGALKAMGLRKTRDNLDRLAEAIDALHLEGSVQKLRGHSVCLSGDSKKRKAEEEGGKLEEGGRLLILNPNAPLKEIPVQTGGTLSLNGSEPWTVQQADSQKLVLVQGVRVDEGNERRQAKAARSQEIKDVSEEIARLNQEQTDNSIKFEEVFSEGGNSSEYPEEDYRHDLVRTANAIRAAKQKQGQLKSSEFYQFPISVETKTVELSANNLVRSEAISDFPVVYIGSSSSFESVPSKPVQTTKKTEVKKFRLSTREKDYIYVLGGKAKYLEDIISSKVQRYDIDENKWETLADMNYARQKLSAVMFNGQLYAVGGKNTKHDWDDFKQAFNYVERYDEAKNQWEEMAPLKKSRYQCNLCVYNGSMYAIGGYCDMDRIKTVERYDEKENKWSLVADVPDDLLGPITAFVFKGSMYVANDDEVYQYDHVNNKWFEPSGMVQYLTCADGQKIVVFEDKIYAVGGTPTNYNKIFPEQFHRFEPKDLSKLTRDEIDRFDWKDHWKRLSDMQKKRSFPQAFVLNGFLYAVGNDEGQQTIEKYDRHTDNWEIVTDVKIVTDEEDMELTKFAAVGTDEFKERDEEIEGFD